MRETLLTTCLLLYSYIMAAQFGPQQIISTEGDGPYRVFTSDFNNDGFIDIIANSSLDDKIVWFKNLDGQGNFSSEIIIEQNSNYYLHDAIDLDSDGDIDIILEETGAPFKLYHKKNIDGNGTFGSLELFLDNNLSSLQSIDFADIDNDNDLDLILSFTSSTGIFWFENLDGLGTFSNEILLIDNNTFYIPLVLEDIDEDGLVDILTATDLYDPAKIIWFKNLGEGNFGVEQEIYQFDFFQSDWTSVLFMKYVDINADGKKDIVANCHNDDVIGSFRVCLENIDNEGNFNIPFYLENVSAYDDFYDLDNDGDNDALSFSYLNNEIYWFENIDSAGDFGNKRIISTEVLQPRHIKIEDFNNDGLLDVVSVSSGDNKVAWYPNTGVLGISENIENIMEVYPNPVNENLHVASKVTVTSIEIIDSLGKKLYSFTNIEEINFSSFASGIYFVKITLEDGTSEIKKVLKQ